jgi:hypothetical protein
MRSWMHTLALLLAFASLSLTACEIDYGVRTVPGVEPPTRVDARIEVETDHPTDDHTLDFGEVLAEETRTKEVTIRNVGDDTLQVQELLLSNVASFEIVNQGEYAMLLAPNAQTVVRVAYSPLQDEHVEGTLVIASNDRESSEVAVRLLAEGLAPMVDVQPPSFDFGNLELGCPNSLQLTIANVGRAPLEVDEIWFEDLAGSGELVFDNPNEASFELMPDESTVVAVHYTPLDVEPDSGIVHVLTNTPAEPADGATAQQFGIGHLGGGNLDLFLQDGNNATDILFVVDSSGSMGDEQTALAVNFASFLQIIDALEVDYHLAVTSMDVAGCGQFVGAVPVITPSTPDPGGTFSANVNLGISGSATEQGLHCGYQALSSALNGVGNTAGFLRDDAGLRIIFVSDEQDQSGSVMGWSTPDYVDWFQSLKPNPEHVVLSDISGGMAGCSGAGGSASSGSEYVLATQMTGGISASICDPSWVSTLSALGWLSQSFADTFELSQMPIEETIEVRLNSVPVYVGWVYEVALNAILFDLDHVPENGDSLEVEYTVMGDCTG